MEISVDLIAQIWIVVFGIPSIWLISRIESWKRWGYIIGLCSQPAWWYTAIKNEQHGVLILCIWFTYSWIQ